MHVIGNPLEIQPAVPVQDVPWLHELMHPETEK